MAEPEKETVASEPAAREFVLCYTTYVKGEAFMRECARLGCRVLLVTLEKHRDADWPRDVLDEIVTMPEGLTLEQITNTISYLARGRRIDRIVALDEFDMETAAHLREHLRLPGMGRTTTGYFRDKLAMRIKADQGGILVPEFTGVSNYDDIRLWMDKVPAPWLLKPRTEASAIGIRKIHQPEGLWRALDELGDRQSHYLLERFVPGDIFHVDAITWGGKVIFAAASQYGKPPMQTMHEGGVFTTRTIDRKSADARALLELNAKLVPELGMVRGVTHAEYIKSHADGRWYFLEVAARVGGAFIAELVEYANGLNLWAEWARIEIAAMRGVAYELPKVTDAYAGSVLCLAREEYPDTSGFDAPEVVHHLKRHHHAGLIVRSPSAERVKALLEEYAARFAEQFLAVQPVPDKPTA
jgi:biotin carboxylase